MSKKCPNCNNEISSKYNKFCSRSCSNSHNNKLRIRTTKSKLKTSNSVKTYISNMTDLEIQYRDSNRKVYQGPHSKIFAHIKCSCCSNNFWQKTKDRKTCSPECARINSTYRKIVHYYIDKNSKIIVLESSWEVEIATWLDKNNIVWIRPKHIVWTDASGKHRKYFPDFYLPKLDLYLDPKNEYQISISKEKLKIISSKIKLVYGKVPPIIAHILTLV